MKLKLLKVKKYVCSALLLFNKSVDQWLSVVLILHASQEMKDSDDRSNGMSGNFTCLVRPLCTLLETVLDTDLPEIAMGFLALVLARVLNRHHRRHSIPLQQVQWRQVPAHTLHVQEYWEKSQLIYDWVLWMAHRCIDFFKWYVYKSKLFYKTYKFCSKNIMVLWFRRKIWQWISHVTKHRRNCWVEFRERK